MTLNLGVPASASEPLLKPLITVVGVGGAGGNAVNNMIQSALEGVEFVVANTDAQSLSLSRTDRRIQLGGHATSGLGAGARPEVGRASAEEAIDDIARELQNSNMAFITAGMGGGTGTGAAPVVARAAKELGILTVGVVTKPFQFEGLHRMRIAEKGIEELADAVDTLIIIPNQNLFRVANEKTTFADAFKMADDVLNSGVRSVTDLMMMPGLINLDFADVHTVMAGMGRAMMGTGEAEGEKRALDAAEAAIANPLLEDTSMKGASGVLINITGGSDVTLFEVDEAANRIRDEVDQDAHIIFGSCFDETLEGRIRVSVVATGIEGAMAQTTPKPMTQNMASTIFNTPTVATPAEPAPQKAPALAPSPAAAPAPAPAQQAMATPPQQPVQQKPLASPATPAVAEQPATTLAPAVATTDDPTAAIATARSQAPMPAAAQAQAVADAVAKAGTGQTGHQPAARVATPLKKPADTFIPNPPVKPAAPQAPQMTKIQPMAPKPAAAQPEPEARPEGSKLSLFSRSFGLGRAKPEEAPKQAEVKQPEVKQTQAPTPVTQTAQGNLKINVEPDDRPVSSQQEDELEIPAFLRRQAN